MLLAELLLLACLQSLMFMEGGLANRKRWWQENGVGKFGCQVKFILFLQNGILRSVIKSKNRKEASIIWGYYLMKSLRRNNKVSTELEPPCSLSLEGRGN
uniref:Lysine-specific demethylase REF6 n=1 Tax=Rhizophora mucronata TaxID=61149 RepID=A0A2P2L4B5_RHIMU